LNDYAARQSRTRAGEGVTGHIFPSHSFLIAEEGFTFGQPWPIVQFLNPANRKLPPEGYTTMAVKNFYAVQAGRVPGIYENWA